MSENTLQIRTQKKDLKYGHAIRTERQNTDGLGRKRLLLPERTKGKRGITETMSAKYYEPYKRITKLIFSLTFLFLETAVYGQVWNGYYNRIIEYPFWRRGNWLMIALYAALLALFLHTYGGLRIGDLKRGNLFCSQLLSFLFVNSITYVQISLIDKKFHNPRELGVMMVLQLVLAFVCTFIFQTVYKKIFPPKKMILIRENRSAFHLMEKIHSREDKYYLEKAVHIDLGTEEIMRQAAQYDALIIGDIEVQKRNDLLKRCFENGIRTYIVPKISDILIRSSSDLDIFDSPLLLSKNRGLTGEQELIKRMVDLLLSGLGLVVTSPFFLIIGLAIKLTDGGPVFYCQDRLTKGGKIFRIYKFRTMIQNAEQAGNARLASEYDDRILPVGRFLRSTRLDELPQLVNIFKGDMSLVGPRPERPELAAEIERELPEFSYRLKVKAGLTGYAQVYGKYNTTSYDKLKLDLAYIRNYSILLDLKLMLMTPKIMMLKESAEGVKIQ